MMYSEFVGSLENRTRYWLRAFIGSHVHRLAKPNAAHLALARIKQPIVTQNVDGLHQDAGSERVVELHGSLRDTRCLHCNIRQPRQQFYQRLASLNAWLDVPALLRADNVPVRPDGDVDVSRLPQLDELLRKFSVPSCDSCDEGIVKPDFCYFGESVPKHRVQKVSEMVQDADALLVVGSSLHVWSAFRFVRMANELEIPIAIVNAGSTRADDMPMVKLRLHTHAGQTLKSAFLA